jgi:hypothetical protein
MTLGHRGEPAMVGQSVAYNPLRMSDTAASTDSRVQSPGPTLIVVMTAGKETGTF